MAEMFEQTKNIAVAGTSGKSTTTGMIGHIMSTVGRDPTVMNGAVMLNTGTNFRFGRSEYTVFEADESDGYEDVIIVCPADIAVLTNISLDHFEVDELKGMFSQFLAQSKTGAVINADCPISRSIQGAAKQVVTFGGGADAEFSLARYPVELEIPGAHNALNALAALAACSLRGIDPKEGLAALRSFKGISRRLEVVGRARGVTVFDDFASNPGKISASLGTVISSHRRVFAVFQPHGFQPTKMMKDGYIETFSTVLRADDELLMPDIYYVGGTTNLINGQAVALPKDISSRDVIEGVKSNGRSAQYLPTRDQIIEYLQSAVDNGDAVVVMGSRDETLPEFSRAIAAALAV
jgi:UDP-N-acetylmuramate--alanine ligase